MPAWNDCDVALLRKAWEEGGIKAAILAFPDRSAKALEAAAYSRHIKITNPQCGRVRSMSEHENGEHLLVAPLQNVVAEAIAEVDDEDRALEKRLSSIETRLAKIESDVCANVAPAALNGQHVSIAVHSAPGLSPSVPIVSGKQEPLKQGKCDRGDCEHIRRRIDFTVHSLSSELHRTQVAIREAIVDLVRRGFEPDALARISIAPESCEGSSVHLGGKAKPWG